MNTSDLPTDDLTLTGHGYVPGQCNLGSREVTRRRRVGYIGLSLSVGFMILAQLLNVPKGYLWLLFFPLAYSFTGFFQARQQFCVLYGVMGLARPSDTGKFVKIKDRTDHQKDLRMVVTLLLKASAAALLVTALYYLLAQNWK